MATKTGFTVYLLRLKIYEINDYCNIQFTQDTASENKLNIVLSEVHKDVTVIYMLF